MRGLLDLLFPLRCLGCRRGGWPFCDSCREEVVELLPPGCRRCGRPLAAEVASCRDCPPAPLGQVRAPFLYSGPIREALHGLKFSGLRVAVETLGQAKAVSAGALPPAVAVAWVPLSRARRAARGFDQAEALARVVARDLHTPVQRLLVRTTDTPPQARRPAVERRGAMQGVFRTAGRIPRTVLLVDDVMTTGATLSACAAALCEGGARRVDAVVAARALGGPVPARSA